ncbi:MAG TPA: alkaline phosphatase family protein [Thermoanaerobaculia bacterium]|jgi:phospholipase C|nr:alkaline phosphatase family protein [Thermoanaerobaculia bacterium]
MATQRSATIYITNATDGNAQITLFHTNSSNGAQGGTWSAAPGATVGPLTVHFETGFGTGFISDYWSVILHVKDGSAPGIYASTAKFGDPPWSKECQLQHQDADQTITLSVGTATFDIPLVSGHCSDSMTRVAAGATPITNVFVLMLENHSFDHFFAMSGIKGITHATTSDFNEYDGTQYFVQSSAPVSMATDPGHEFEDVLEQLAGPGATYQSGGTYPKIVNSGFAANYATSTTEGPAPPPEDNGEIMALFATPSQLPVLYAAATNYALCDHWYASLPGPTWPNRFFVHGASSSGLDDSPSNEQIGEWEVPGDGFEYGNGSIYQALAKAGIPYRFYNDAGDDFLSLYSDDPQNGSVAGAIPQVTALKDVTVLDFYSLRHFASDLQGPYPYPYTFIEPHYGEVANGTYAGGSSQHPMDDTYGGENLVAAVYAAIRNSPYWSSSLLIITYDEHGGLYDSYAPPAAVAPGDTPPHNYSKHGFTFEQYGVRVPAIVISPLVPSGTVSNTPYDHSSVLATLEKLFGLNPLTNRDKNANDVLPLLSLGSPRTDCPTSLGTPASLGAAARPRLTDEEQAAIDARPLPQSGTVIGALGLLKKAELELSGGTPPELAAIKARHESVKTRGDARAYAESVMAKVRVARDAKRQAERVLGKKKIVK